MTIDWTKPLQTRDGRKARVVATDIATKHEYTHAALIMDKNGEEILETYTKDGFCWVDRKTRDKDLVNIFEEQSRWMNVYSNSTMAWSYDTRDDANSAANSQKNRIAILQVKIQGERVTDVVIHEM